MFFFLLFCFWFEHLPEERRMITRRERFIEIGTNSCEILDLGNWPSWLGFCDPAEAVVLVVVVLVLFLDWLLVVAGAGAAPVARPKADKSDEVKFSAVESEKLKWNCAKKFQFQNSPLAAFAFCCSVLLLAVLLLLLLLPPDMLPRAKIGPMLMLCKGKLHNEAPETFKSDKTHPNSCRRWNSWAHKRALLDQNWAAAQVTRRYETQVQHQIADGMLSVRHVMKRLGYAIEDSLSIFTCSIIGICRIALKNLVVLLDKWIQATLHRLHLPNDFTERLCARRLLSSRRWSSGGCLSWSGVCRWSFRRCCWLVWWRVVCHVRWKLDGDWRWCWGGGRCHAARHRAGNLNSWRRVVLLNGDVVDAVLAKRSRHSPLKCLHDILHILLRKISVGNRGNPNFEHRRLHRLLSKQVHVLIV